MDKRVKTAAEGHRRLAPVAHLIGPLNHAMSARTLAVLVMTTCATSLASCRTATRSSSQLDALCRELLRTQQEYAGVVVPDPIGISPLEKEDAELQRRFGIVINTWNDYLRGKRDAQRALAERCPTLLGFGPLNAYEKTYVELLRKEFGARFVRTTAPVADLHRRAYIYGHNKEVAEHLVQQHEFMAFVELIKRAVRQHTTEKPNYYSPFFIPWRFNDDAHIIELDSFNSLGVPTLAPSTEMR